MQNFIGAVIKGKKYPLSFKDEFRILKILDFIEASNKKGKRLLVKV